MKIVDDRKQLTLLVVGQDKNLAKADYGAWACKPEDVRSVRDWVEKRTACVNISTEKAEFIPKNAKNYHIYIADMTTINKDLSNIYQNKNTFKPEAIQKAKTSVNKGIELD